MQTLQISATNVQGKFFQINNIDGKLDEYQNESIGTTINSVACEH